jgi:propionyl-CoA carboxylase alpha chain
VFSKILIANRGEIACRVIKSARKMGIKTVAVYSEADADALHVSMADEAVLIGPAPAAESYLVIENIIDAIKKTGAEAVHPGYGFLSENAAFANALKEAGITFIGPHPHAISAMGDKIESKKLAQAAGVNTIPGYLGAIPNADDAVGIAKDIGFPVMIKASAGGGGKGLRVAYSEDEVTQGFQSATNEARASFGDDRIFIEKYASEPRHIEVQVLGDKHGNVIHLGERECSIQRRHQKVIEEAPSPFVDKKTRAEMGAQAVALAKAVDYESAGTVEFIVDKDRNFFFLEMNTRLQVEHPVTELITGVDLVEQMIRVAAGQMLSISQEDISITGWAVESRIYAEDPFRGFLPSIGRLVRYCPPPEETENGLTIRNDTGVQEGGEISLYYDPMIAKLCTHGPNRQAAIDHMSGALDEFYIEGIQHNVPFLNAVMSHKRFQEGRLTTGFIAEEFPDGFEGADLDETTREILVAVAARADTTIRERDWQISGQVQEGGAEEDLTNRVVTLDGKNYEICVGADDVADDDLEVDVLPRWEADRARHLIVTGEWTPGTPLFRGQINGRDVAVQVKPVIDGFELNFRGATVKANVRSQRAAELAALMPEKVAPDTSKYLLCPMPGLVVSIDVEVGQEVKAGEALAVVEAMKMENVLVAERDGVVGSIAAEQGDSLSVDEVILEFE